MLDEDLADIYKYIKYDILTDDNAKNKKLFLMAGYYYIENDKLFKIAPPRSKKLSRVKPIVNQLCLPRKFRFHILSQTHDILGHYSYGRLYPMISTQYYWPQMRLTIKQYTKTCDTCQKTKIPTKGPSLPLYPIVREIMGRYSTPTSIISDKGQNFVSHLFGYIAKIYGINHVT